MGYEEFAGFEGLEASGDIVGDIVGALMCGEDDAAGDIVGALIGSGYDFESAGADPLQQLMAAAGATAPAGKNAALLRALAPQLANAKKRAALAAAIRRQKLAGFRPETFQYSPPDYNKARIVPMGFDSGVLIAPGATATITQRPQVPFRPARLMIPSDIAGAVLVSDFKVGNKSQLAANSSLPGRAFQEDATDSKLLLDTATPALDVVLIVQNIGGAPFRFIAMVSGPAVELSGLLELLSTTR